MSRAITHKEAERTRHDQRKESYQVKKRERERERKVPGEGEIEEGGRKIKLDPSPPLETMNNLSGAARRVTRNLDQFSVICVFGSVVGCVVLPLMIQVSERGGDNI